MNEERIMAEIREANLSYLILAQSLIRTDRVQALYRLGLSEDVADLIDQLSPAQLMRMAQGNMLLCRFRFDDAMLWSLLADHGEGVTDERAQDRSASRLHAAILRSGKFEETLNERA
ncbi:MAG: flagellar transcriptional regulator FlhD [Lautropia sp.]|nr:flagellar transcriptional regulator FlhD [Lautropia sp.]